MVEVVGPRRFTRNGKLGKTPERVKPTWEVIDEHFHNFVREGGKFICARRTESVQRYVTGEGIDLYFASAQIERFTRTTRPTQRLGACVHW